MKSGAWRLLLFVFLVAAVALHRELLTVLASVLIIATAASDLWARYCLSNLTYRRRLGDHAIGFGQETALVLEFENAKPLPLAWLLVRDAFPGSVQLLTAGVEENAPGEGAALLSLLSLSWYQRVTRIHRLRGMHRGRFEFGPAQLSSGDLFGHRRRTEHCPQVDELLVYPRIVPVEEFGLPASRPMGEWFAPRRVVADPLAYAGVHKYQPGDSPRHVHWRATARTGELQIKEFDPGAAPMVTIALDVQTLPRTYEYLPDTLEYIIMVAASIAMHALDEQYQVGLYANGLTRHAETWSQVRPGRGVHQETELLSAFAALEPFRGMPFDELLVALSPEMAFGTGVIAITAHLREDILEALDSLQRSGHPVLLLTAGETMPYVPDSIPSFHLGEPYEWSQATRVALA